MAKIANKSTTETGVVFTFANGEVLDCDIGGLTEDIINRLAVHGLAQKVGDSYAGAESVADAIRLATTVFGNLKSGLWAAKASRGGKIVEALHRATGQPMDDCLEKFAGMTEDEKKALRKHPAIKVALAEIEAERAAALADNAEEGSDLNDLF